MVFLKDYLWYLIVVYHVQDTMPVPTLQQLLFSYRGIYML